MSENPYQSPTDDNGESPGNGWYKPDHRALTYAELWRICSKPGPFVVAALKKAMGVAISGPATFKSLEPIIVLREDQIGADALKRLQPLVADCLAHDFELAFYGTGEHRGAEGFAAHLWRRDGTTWALVISSMSCAGIRIGWRPGRAAPDASRRAMFYVWLTTTSDGLLNS